MVKSINLNVGELLPEQRPDIDTGISRAWLMDLPGAHQKRFARDIAAGKYVPPIESTVAGWLIYAPWAHPLWHTYTLSVVPVDTDAPAPYNMVEYFPGVTHEMLLFALDPDAAERYSLQGGNTPLVPFNYVGQFRCASADAVKRICAETVSDICQALLNPDTDAFAVWCARFGEAAVRGVDRSHLRYERRVHPRDPLAAWDAPVHFHLAPGGHA